MPKVKEVQNLVSSRGFSAQLHDEEIPTQFAMQQALYLLRKLIGNISQD